MTTSVEKNGRAMGASRPTPTEIAAILSNLEPTGSVVTVPALIAALRQSGNRLSGRLGRFGLR
jgi:hypothetical protein